FRVPKVHIYTTPYAGLVQSGPRHVNFNLVTVPYPHKGILDALRPDLSDYDKVEEASRMLENAIETMIDTVRAATPNVPVVFLGHLSAIGAQLGSEQT